MGWRADQIYTKPSDSAIQALREIPGLRDRLFLVNNLRGVRETEGRGKFPQLPPGGILVVAPVIYGTGYDTAADAEFHVRHRARDRDETWEMTVEGGLRFFARLAARIAQPFFHYDCEMWGGDIENESGTVFLPDRELSLAYPRDDVLGDGLLQLGLRLPGAHWDLHVCSFQWSTYWMGDA